MYHALGYFLDFDTARIDQLRRKYDPTVDLIAPHITLAFPLSAAEVSREALVEHVAAVTGRWQPFPVHLCGLVKSWDHWLFLTPREGNEEITWLFDDLCSGILAPHRSTTIQFIPHVGLGLFVQAGESYDLKDPREAVFDSARYAAAVREAEQLRLDAWCNLDRLELIALEDDFSRAERIQTFWLSKPADEPAS